MSADIITPPAYLIARTEVPVTMGCFVRSVAADVEARTDPPDSSVRDMIRISSIRVKMVTGVCVCVC